MFSVCLFFLGNVAPLFMPLYITLATFFTGMVMTILAFLYYSFVKREQMSFDLVWRTGIAISLFCYTSLCDMAFRGLSCVDVEGEFIMFNQPSISCNSFEYKVNVIIQSLVVALVIVGLPALVFMMARRLSHFARYTMAADLPLQVRWGLIYEPYKSDAYYYESVMLMRRALYVALVIGLEQNPVLQHMMVAICSLLLLVFHLHVHPFKLNILNRLETTSLALHVIFTIFLSGTPMPYTFTSEVVISCFILVPTILYLIWWFYTKFINKAGVSLSLRLSGLRLVPPAVPSGLVEEHIGGSEDEIGRFNIRDRKSLSSNVPSGRPRNDICAPATANAVEMTNDCVVEATLVQTSLPVVVPSAANFNDVVDLQTQKTRIHVDDIDLNDEAAVHYIVN
jgi:hypothetical protein